ncbi:unnamed protein product [Rhizophagus irregularis]|nr:unnamed protein product [Rhizophagus irregularis]
MGKEQKKNLNKPFVGVKKQQKKDHIIAMFNLANHYYNGKGTEKNFEKAFNWCQKAAEKGQIDAMYNLSIYYRNGEGIEKNLEKAFYWYKKAAEKDHTIAMFNLAACYKNGEGTEKDFVKAFHWYQKAAGKDHIISMFNLANHYYNGKGTEKNFEKAFHWCQKAAEKGQIDAMLNLAAYYRNGEGTEKNLEKAFYWHQKAVESNKMNPKNGVELCNECKQPNNNYQWCQKCNTKQFRQDFSKWTKWIPYNELSNINYYDKGGFSEIHKAIWSDGPIFSWNFDTQQWNRQPCYVVILKILNNSSSLNSEFLNEWKYHYNCQKKSFSKFIQFFGFTQDPNNLNYIIVMSYAKQGSLRKCLSDIIKFKWQDKLQLLKKIILGLKVIHESNLTHGDFHDGNILISDNYNELFVIDLGLCKPISDLQNADNDNNEIYGVLPYMAPEILRKKPYTSASDIYSFSMIMWEFSSGIPPYSHEAHDQPFIWSVYKGKRPKIIENTPKCYTDLIKKCWDLNPSNRPTIKMLENIISEWIRCINRYYEVNRDENYEYEIPDIDNQLRNDMLGFVEANKSLMRKQANTSIIQSHSHPQAYYTSRKVTEILIQEDSQGYDCKIDDY